VGVVFVSDRAIRRLNRDWRGIDKPTDVLSFAMREGEGPAGGSPSLGDVVISVDTAARQAAELGHSFDEEVERLLVHGLLHLFGYDHREAAERRRMQAMERRLLRVIRQE